MTRLHRRWAEARDLDALVAERLGLIGEEATRRRARAWGLAVLGVLLVAFLLSPVVAGGQVGPSGVATPAQGRGKRPPTTQAAFSLPDAYSTDEDAPLVVPASRGVLANDFRAFGDHGSRALEAELAGPPTRGTVDLRPDGSFAYVPAPNVHGVDTFDYSRVDPAFPKGSPGRHVSGARVVITVTAVNDPPVAAADHFEAPAGAVLSIGAPGVLANDSDVDGDPLRASLHGLAIHGEVTMAADGSLRYRPDPGVVGADSFTYVASDGKAGSLPGVVTIEVTPGAPAPTTIDSTAPGGAPGANDDGYSTGAGQILEVPAPGVLANDDAADTTALVARPGAGPGHGALELEAGGGFTYTPDPTFRGLDRFTYVASDGDADSTPATVTIVVGPAEDAFALADDSFALEEDTTLAVAAPGVLGNDGVEGTARQAEVLRAPASGIVELGGDGSVIYVPDPDFAGEDSFEYVVRLGEAISPPARVALTVEPAEEPLPPTPPTTSIAAAPVAPPAGDAPVPEPAFAPAPAPAPGPGSPPPAPGDAGPTGGGDSAPEDGGTAPADGAAGSAGGAAPVDEGQAAVTIDVAGDLAGMGGAPPVVNLEAPPPKGEVIVNGDGTVTYVPAPDFVGRDAFGYRACTLERACTTGRIELVVADAPDGGAAPEVRFEKIEDSGGVPWPALALALAALAFAVIMAVVVVRALRSPPDPFKGTTLLPDDAASPRAPPIASEEPC